ncbi:DUF1641 domain-containing protein [Actibacterium sp. XHP0104]|uniref:DUF1641 domain-containing protein n=1 Tax=Actibacterium sp. XHP0104 TaxID=2984335 RepID=UPI0021E81267|nr:DUF1641 domain-containing protein [Actibacterium sp. XHP0104]MCV2882998.1 DUF1641 domain-containing protein [Actibacterium sp. XHP0104]
MANPTAPQADTPLLERISQQSAFADAATEAGLIDLANKVAPLIQGRRFHNVVDLMSLAADGVDMADDAMIQKMMGGYEDLVSNLWMLSNAARYASNEAMRQPVPSRMGLLKAAADEDVRRGLHFALQFLAVLGRQTAPQADDA